MKHTPGPWQLEVRSNDHGGWRQREQHVQIWNDATLIADYSTSSCEFPDDDENAANARLIAAAPDLLEVLRDVANNCRRGAHELGMSADGVSAIAAMCDAAIAKATGEGE